jgi:hypothetical protein
VYKINKGQTDIINPLQTFKVLYFNISYISDVTEGNGQKHKKWSKAIKMVKSIKMVKGIKNGQKHKKWPNA